MRVGETKDEFNVDHAGNHLLSKSYMSVTCPALGWWIIAVQKMVGSRICW